MTEDTESTRTDPTTPHDDDRFEVKWKKKASSSSPSPAPEAATESSPGFEDAASLRRELDEAQERIRTLQDKWQRAAADLVNLRRRTEAEREEVEKYASMFLVAEMLPVLDNFERAIATIPGNLAMLTWIQGVMLIERHMLATLQQRGLTEVEAQDKPFNPHFHEAISERETDEAEPGTIVRVYQKGYAMHGQVIRPALVEVAKKPAPTPETQVTETAVTDESPTREIADDAEIENVGP
jgi:molecular chaperone GrpE